MRATPSLANPVEYYGAPSVNALSEASSLVGSRPTRKVPPPGNASIISSWFNLTNTIVGAGVITLPYALRSAGTVAGGAFLLLTCCLSMFSFRLLVRLSDATGLFSYRDIAVEAYGPMMSKVCQLVLMLYTSGTCIGYGVLVGDFIPKVFEHWLAHDNLLCRRDFVIALVAICFMLPLSLLEKMDALKFSSFLALMCVTYTLGVLVDHYHTAGTSSSVELVHLKPSLMVAFPLLVVSFTAHYNALSFYQELKNRSTSRMHRVITYACMTCLAFTQPTPQLATTSLAATPSRTFSTTFRRRGFLFSLPVSPSALSLSFPTRLSTLPSARTSTRSSSSRPHRPPSTRRASA
ncbi:amino Acid/Auxin Permease family [Thecamonas trahens ATCC 50062]|uniref:Amino Acid/Auxin Permease family n=1 Tax=Thecamonas trahens ATCC 50062 TaxID=461836 RepID=A0A0L0DK87_THETB|nr:amino Acid/Auxin Permease family [Thecamonas trahens ATCC 50062]KNC52697.1 amino Acid/Auxin Permease family [Thecamonas trahens ATCC 50062]|eukprot:XP_013755241.1 amino Acid/Auxin Permease family [Thecamonas trahens ATCC 50062]